MDNRSESNPIEIKPLRIDEILRHPQTQSRSALSSETITEYANLLRAGVAFPPVRVWFDGRSYSLSDGYHRLAAAESIGRVTFAAEIINGGLEEAVWDSLGANTRHGLRRSPEDCRLVVQRAIAHKNASLLSNVQLAKHLGIPEPTLRRWRKALSSGTDLPAFRVAHRDGKAYEIRIDNIGHNSSGKARRANVKPMSEIKRDISEMRRVASPETCRLLNVLEKWLFAGLQVRQCIAAIEGSKVGPCASADSG